MYNYVFRSLPPRKKFKRQVSPDEIDRAILKELQKEEKDDEDLLFSQSIGVSLKKMTDQQKALVKMKISQLMYEIQYCNEAPNTPYYPPSDTPMY